MELQYNQIKIFLECDNSIGIGGSRWPSTDQFCSFVSDPKWKSFFLKIFDNKKCLELGSGTGLAGILVDMLFPINELVITDLQEYVPLIERNISLNENKKDNWISRCRAEDLDWCNLKEQHKLNKFDVIFAFECVYKEELYSPLIDALEATSHINTIIFLGLTRFFAKSQFFKMLQLRGFKYTLIPKDCFEERYWDQYSDRDVGIFLIQKYEIISTTSSNYSC